MKELNSFKELFTWNKDEQQDLKFENLNLITAVYSAKHIEMLRDEFKNTYKKLIDLLNIKKSNKLLKDRINEFNSEQWIQHVYSYMNASVKKYEDLTYAINFHNILFPDEPALGLTEEEIKIINQIKGIEIIT